MADRQRASVSVVLPVFWREADREHVRLLRRALDSVALQDFPDEHEVIIIDDGSAIPVADLVPLANDERGTVRILRSERNHGLSHALNLGLLAARFRFIARLDADDCWLARKIGKQLRLFADDPDLTLTATGMTLVDPRGLAIETHIRPGDWTGVLRFCSDLGCPLPHGSVVARRDIYSLLGGYPQDPAYRHCEDYALWSVWLRFFKAVIIEEALYDYTVSSRSISAVHATQQANASHEVNRRFRRLNLPDFLPAALSELAHAIGGSVLQAGILAYRLWRFRVAARLSRAAIAPLRAILPDRRLVESVEEVGVFDLSRVIGEPVSAVADERTVVVRAV
jgi:glycosyltransferase involved in cell wall biosynthesis